VASDRHHGCRVVESDVSDPTFHPDPDTGKLRKYATSFPYRRRAETSYAERQTE
jgi:hypothetical protein